jgi:hypothetical protein
LSLPPATLSDAAKARGWLAVLAHSARPTDPLSGQLERSAQLQNRLAAYNAITRALLVTGLILDFLAARS